MREWFKRILYYFEPRKPTTSSEVFRTYDEKWNIPKTNTKIPATGRPTASTPMVNRNNDDFSRVAHESVPDNTVTNMLLGAVVYDAISSDHSSSSYDSSSSSYDSGSSSDCGSSSSDGGGSCGGCD